MSRVHLLHRPQADRSSPMLKTSAGHIVISSATVTRAGSQKASSSDSLSPGLIQRGFSSFQTQKGAAGRSQGQSPSSEGCTTRIITHAPGFMPAMGARTVPNPHAVSHNGYGESEGERVGRRPKGQSARLSAPGAATQRVPPHKIRKCEFGRKELEREKRAM